MATFCAIIAVLACLEILSIMKISKISEFSVLTCVFVTLEIIFHSLKLQFPKKYDEYGSILFFIFVFISFFLMLKDVNLKFKTVSKVCIVAIFITFSLNHLVSLQNNKFLTQGFAHNCNIGNFFVLITLLLAWYTDMGGYFFGTFLGKKKLCKTISPKKTVEGFFGGVFFCVTCMTLTVFLAEKFVFVGIFKVNYLRLFVATLLGSVISSFGDLYFSFIKRSCKVKDFGEIIPGHGGILDRFDSVIFVAPYFYYALKFFKIFN